MLRRDLIKMGSAASLGFLAPALMNGADPAEKEAGATLRIYSARAPEGFGDSVQYGGFASSPLQTWERVKKECDVVLLPYHWEPGFRDLYQAHFPSKLPEYLALGVPVLITGPAYAAGVAWGLQHPRAALTVSDPSQEAMRDAFIRLRDEPSLRVALATEAVDVGSKEFDPEAIRGQFIQKLREVVSQADSSCD